ncbi:MAG: hypothetical protein B7Z34_09435 [Novosphingobium sp. 12-62-10]|nr:MAG: hypothetical protein B7Z34_09435 [Novosphingobium sp. 12-62-10]
MVDDGTLPFCPDQETPVYVGPISPAHASPAPPTLLPTRVAKPRHRWPAMKRAQIGIAAATILWSAAFGFITQYAAIGPKPDGWQTVALAIVLHAPFLAILSFLAFGLIERFDYFRIAARPPRPGNLPARVPKVCVQLPMFNEDAVAERIITAACALQWPREALEVQVLDDSTDEATRVRVRAFCEQIAAETGVDCRWIHRTDRQGYKAGALEAARIMTDARYFAIFDADFIPPPDFLARTIPHFYDITGRSIPDLAVVQAQWGHLNDTESFLTCAQALWVDDHRHRGGRGLARSKPCRRLRTQHSRAVCRLSHTVCRQHRRPGRIAQHHRRLSLAAKALDARLGAIAAAAHEDAAVALSHIARAACLPALFRRDFMAVVLVDDVDPDPALPDRQRPVAWRAGDGICRGRLCLSAAVFRPLCRHDCRQRSPADICPAVPQRARLTAFAYGAGGALHDPQYRHDAPPLLRLSRRHAGPAPRRIRAHPQDRVDRDHQRPRHTQNPASQSQGQGR